MTQTHFCNSIPKADRILFCWKFHISSISKCLFLFTCPHAILNRSTIYRMIYWKREREGKRRKKNCRKHLETFVEQQQKKLTNSTGNVECAIYKYVHLWNAKNRSHSNEVICVIPQTRKTLNTHRFEAPKIRNKKNIYIYYRIIVETHQLVKCVVNAFINMNRPIGTVCDHCVYARWVH